MTNHDRASVAAVQSLFPDAAEAVRRIPFAWIFLQQVRQFAGDWRCYGSAGLLIAVMVLAAVSAGERYRRESLARESIADGQARATAGLTLDQVVDVPIQAVKPPWRLTLVADGAQAITPDVYSRPLSPWSAPEIRLAGTGNYRLPGREPIDWTSILRVILPLTAFLLGYDLVCSERHAGNLKLVLSYPVSRVKVLAAKVAALWLCMAVPIVAGCGASLLLARSLGIVPLGREELAKAALVAVLALWSAGFFALIALLVSTLSRDAATSLSLLAWLWVTGVIAVPALSGLLAHRLFPVPSEQATARRLSAADEQVAREFAGRERHWRRRELASSDAFAWEKVSAAAELRRSTLQEAVRRQVLDDKLAQARIARRIAAASPASLASTIGELLAGSGVERDVSFLDQAAAYVAACAVRVEAMDRADPASAHLYFFSGYLSRQPLVSGALPKFAFRERSLRQGLAAARPRLAAFAVETAALALACLLAFARLNVG